MGDWLAVEVAGGAGVVEETWRFGGGVDEVGEVWRGVRLRRAESLRSRLGLWGLG